MFLHAKGKKMNLKNYVLSLAVDGNSFFTKNDALKKQENKKKYPSFYICTYNLNKLAIPAIG